MIKSINDFSGTTIDTTFYLKLQDSGKINLEYLYFALKNANLSSFAIITAIPGINREDLKKVKIPIPTLEEQKRLVLYLNKIRDTLESLKKLQQETEEELEKLVPAILDKAFRGEL